LHEAGEASPMPNFRIQELKILGFEWNCKGAASEDRFSELADYRKIHGHCNVPQNYSEITKLGLLDLKSKEHLQVALASQGPSTTARKSY
jgi:hypothetical protein